MGGQEGKVGDEGGVTMTRIYYMIILNFFNKNGHFMKLFWEDEKMYLHWA